MRKMSGGSESDDCVTANGRVYIFEVRNEETPAVGMKFDSLDLRGEELDDGSKEVPGKLQAPFSLVVNLNMCMRVMDEVNVCVCPLNE
ncbi:hypothetical protein Prudu_004829 [Prunus dulcis]|uniref:Uncharacterized protein n=1 Tax=Prunus dulcis TaxID=3755 RepID=A0A4Y1QWD2_PRUDU|nr:hypothetical protein Prudu_004829 [Prunus dulcis]